MDEQDPIPFWTNEDPRLHLLSWGGEGLPLLLLHGMAGGAHWWDGVAPRLVETFKPVALDFSGHGDSGWDEKGRYGLERWAEDVEQARHALGWSKFVLIGHSMGGRVALEYAARHPERLLAVGAFDFLCALDSTTEGRFMRARARPQPHYASREEALSHFRLQPPGTLLPPEALKTLGARMVKKTAQGWTWRFDWRAFGTGYPPVWPTLEKIALPALIMRGERSAVMPRPDFDRVVSSLKAAQGVELPKAHHHTPLDLPEQTADAILKFAGCLRSVA